MSRDVKKIVGLTVVGLFFLLLGFVGTLDIDVYPENVRFVFIIISLMFYTSGVILICIVLTNVLKGEE